MQRRGPLELAGGGLAVPLLELVQAQRHVGQGEGVEGQDVPLDAQPADLAQDVPARLEVALGHGLLVGGPQRLEGVPRRGARGADVDDPLLRSGRDPGLGGQEEEARGQQRLHAPPALVPET